MRSTCMGDVPGGADGVERHDAHGAFAGQLADVFSLAASDGGGACFLAGRGHDDDAVQDHPLQ